MEQTDNTLLLALFKKLALCADDTFSIEISVEKMQEDEVYCQLVLSELSQLKSTEINVIIEDVRGLNKKTIVGVADTSLIAQACQSISALSLLNKMMVSFFLVMVCIFMYIASLFVMQGQARTQPLLSQVGAESLGYLSIENQNPQPLSAESIQNLTPLNQTLIKLPVSSASPVFNLHGSNTIGEKLAPALIEAYLSTQGVTQFYWLQGIHTAERSLQYIKNNKAYVIELHAHGSSTAFKDLKSNTAQIGMASRRVKNKEIMDLSSTLGSLDQVGNEHIIGLDGLAIIVNQNNTIKKLSTQKLAKIFSGEINNWRQLGGADEEINVFARDVNSGTWDTFKNLVLKKFSLDLSPRAIRLESSSELSAKISMDENAIGFIGLNYILHNKALAISEGTETKSIFPTKFTIGTEDYALSRRLYFYTPTAASKEVKDFAHFAISSAGQEVVEELGLISQNINVEQVYPMQGAPKKYNAFTKLGKRLSLNFRFNYGNKDLDNKGKRDLIRLVEFMEDNRGRRLVLMGFSDSIGAKVKNVQLSLRRAMTVERELEARGIPVMSTQGFGEFLPVASNNTESGRERNRRVEVWVL
jgi:phosphate transport system substrate-binding protein